MPKATENRVRASILEQLEDSSRTIAAVRGQIDVLEKAANALVAAYKRGNKILSFGNGGSSCDATNFADELVGRLRRNRAPLPALALTVNTADLTSIANDFGYEQVFARQLEAHAKPGDVAVAISTSGDSPNVLRALESAKRLGLTRIGLTGESGGKMKAQVDLCVRVPSATVARIQEAHIAIIQILCDIVEDAMFPGAPKAH